MEIMRGFASFRGIGGEGGGVGIERTGMAALRDACRGMEWEVLEAGN